MQVSKSDEFCIKPEELCIKNEELCIKNEGFCVKNDEPCSAMDGYAARKGYCLEGRRSVLNGRILISFSGILIFY